MLFGLIPKFIKVTGFGGASAVSQLMISNESMPLIVTIFKQYLNTKYEKEDIYLIFPAFIFQLNRI